MQISKGNVFMGKQRKRIVNIADNSVAVNDIEKINNIYFSVIYAIK